MSKQVWLPPTSGTNQRLDIDSKLTVGIVSPAPAGQSVVPVGWVKQIGWDGFRDTGGLLTLNGVPVPNITIPGVPYYTGCLFPVIGYDPLAGQPYHTKPSYNPVTGIID